VTLLIVAGSLLGLIMGAGASWAVSAYLEGRTGIAIPVTVSWPEVQLVLLLIGGGALLAIVPALAIYRQPVAEALR
jgi:putative ABC transport system permease protein